MTFFEVKNLSVTRDGERALEHVSFSVQEGESVALIGPNGAGKTTLLRALLGDVPYEGEIVWHKKPKIGYVPQKFDFDKTTPLTVEEFFLVYGKEPRPFWRHSAAADREIRGFLKGVKAEHLIHKSIGEISHGELQRVIIAQAMSGRPNILFLDEPTANIDIEGEKTIYPLLKSVIREASLTSIIISHDLSVVYDFADKVVCLNKKMVCEGSPETVLGSAQLGALYGTGTTLYRHEHKKK
ncbi:metal ABC transporter ATP-binding protein [Candidatus Azambacteria bacterium]|nr:metal ABC transporter ATP-binding protein [Candidatus Azambacteria bacterium]